MAASNPKCTFLTGQIVFPMFQCGHVQNLFGYILSFVVFLGTKKEQDVFGHHEIGLHMQINSTRNDFALKLLSCFG